MANVLNVLLAVFVSLVFAFAELGFPRYSVFAGAGIATVVLGLLAICLPQLPNAYLLITAGLVLGIGSISVRQGKGCWILVVDGLLLAALAAISLWQGFALCDRLDAVTSWILKLLAAGVLMYISASDKWQIMQRDTWQYLWNSPSFRRHQIGHLATQSLEFVILLAMERLLSRELAAIFVSLVGAFFTAFNLLGLRMLFIKNENLSLLEAQDSSQQFFHIIRSQRHDFMIHVHTIHGLLVSDQISECRDYVDRLMTESASSNAVLPLESPAVCALLSEYMEQAEKKNIRLAFTLKNDLGQVACTEFELNRIIGNMLNNAMEEVEKYEMDDRWIQVLTVKRGGRSVVKVTNCFRREPSELKNAMQMNFSSKPKHEGIGMKNVERIVKKYGGAFFLELDEGAISVVAQIPNHYGQEVPL